jgi:hypothetical protein
MKIFLILFLLTFILNPPKKSQEKIEIPLNIKNNKSHVTVKVGDVVIPDILLDTGFAFDGLMIYNPDYKDSLDLTDAIEVNIGGAGGGEDSKASMFDSSFFYLGDVEMKNQKILLLQGDIYKGFPSNGLIGYSIFGHYITEFNYDNNTMILHNVDELNPDSTWTAIPVYFKNNNIPWLEVSVAIGEEEPVSISTYIDYAAADPLLLLEKDDIKFRLPEKMTEVHLGKGLSGDIYGRTGQISRLTIGPYELVNVKSSFTDAKVRSKQENADGILGIGLLRRFNTIFDYANKKLYLKPNSHFDEPFN